jgi:predicted alpha/beta-fold hydrolase
MPIIESDYRAPILLRNGHLNTVYPSLFRKLKYAFSERETIDTDDQDLLYLDWYRASHVRSKSSKTLVVVSHGLEGHSERPYVVGLCRYLNSLGLDALAWNFRSCGPFMNRQKRFYHSGATEDLARVIEHAHEPYERIALVGFSMGGNLSLLHCGREASELNSKVKAVVGVSVPCDLEACAHQLSRRENTVYLNRFLTELREKMRVKHQTFPEIPVDALDQIKNLQQFDDLYTAPLHGFEDAKDYWTRSSCLGYLDKIQIPALIVNALDDPFLTDQAYPVDVAKRCPNLRLELPKNGGHVGFVSFNSNGSYWIEYRIGEFLSSVL